MPGSRSRETKTPATASKLFSAKMNPENTSTVSNDAVTTKSRAKPAWVSTATAGMPCRFVRARGRKKAWSLPIAWRTRGPAMIMALTVDTSSRAKTTPMTAAPPAPKTWDAATWPTSSLPSSSDMGAARRKA